MTAASIPGLVGGFRPRLEVKQLTDQVLVAALDGLAIVPDPHFAVGAQEIEDDAKEVDIRHSAAAADAMDDASHLRRARA